MTSPGSHDIRHHSAAVTPLQTLHFRYAVTFRVSSASTAAPKHVNTCREANSQAGRRSMVQVALDTNYY